jgi:ArsR family transcriptional regulator
MINSEHALDALGDATRRRVFMRLRRGTRSVRAIADGMDVSRSAVSQHLKVLKDAGLVRGEIDGPRVGYCIEPRTMRRLKSLVGSL